MHDDNPVSQQHFRGTCPASLPKDIIIMFAGYQLAAAKQDTNQGDWEYGGTE